MGEATIRDVARRAEVSVASVSRALNGLDNVRKETREKVIKAAAELGYVPHAGARSLSLARANAIGVVLPDLHGEFFSECVRGMDREASRHGYVLLLSNMHDDGDQAAAALRAMRGRVDGLLIMAPHIAPKTLESAIPQALPAVLINSHADLPGRPAMRFDNQAGAAAMVEHLVANGYRHIVHIAGPQGNVDADQRARGYREVLARHGLSPNILPGDFNEEAGEEAARHVLAENLPCDAVFAANDMMAIGCLHTLRNAGKRVPEDIAVCGFDDVPLARYLALSTIRVNIAEMGARAVARLIDLLEGKVLDSGSEIQLPELVTRATTAPRAKNADGAAHA